jgi:outer membrane protein assembly factor BamB
MKRKKLKRRHTVGKMGIIFFFSIIVIIFVLVLLVSQSSSKNDQNTVYNANAAGQVVWQQFDGNAEKTGTSDDPYINKSTVSSLKKIWSVSVSSDGSPVYLSGVTTAQGVKNLVFVTTQAGGIIAFDEATGAQIWNKTTSGGNEPTTSSPAIDPSNQFIYNYGQDGKVHKYDVGTGNEESSGGWPLTATLIPDVEKGSSALSVGNGYLYVTTSAYSGDAGSYVGHILAKNLTTGTVTVFNTLCASTKSLLNGNCSSVQSGVWARPGVVVDPNTGNIFIASGNGSYNPPNNLGDSLIELSPDLSKVIDTYTPTNFQELDNDDADLGSTLINIIPGLELGIQGGKDNKIRVINLKNLSGQGGPYHTGGELQTLSVNCNIFSSPISWSDGSTIWVFVTDMCNNLYAYKVVNNGLQQVYKNTSGGSSPLMVNGVLFIQSSGAIKAVDPTTGTVLWTGSVGSIHWQSPAVINGHVFVIDKSNLTAFSVPNTPTPTGILTTTAPGTSTPGNPEPTNFVCLGSCPTPTSSFQPTATPLISTPSVSIIPTSVPTPCITSSGTTGSESIKTHQHQNANVSNIFKLLLQLLLLLFRLLSGGGNTGTVPSPGTTPCVTPIQ